MKHKGHVEGNLIPGRADLTAMMPYLMKRRCDSLIFFEQNIDVEPFLAYSEKRKAEGTEVKFFSFFVAAVVKLLRERPQLNRYIKGRKLYQRDDVLVGTVVKRSMDDKGQESNIVLHFKPEDNFQKVLQILQGEVRLAKTDPTEQQMEDDKAFEALLKLPRWLLMFIVKILDFSDFYKAVPKFFRDIDPMRCSIMLANLGSIGIEAPYHHLFEWGTCSIFATIGKIQKKPVVVSDETGDKIVAKTMVNVKIVMDERITDGFYCARSLDLLESYFANPETVEQI
ncbi:MAG: 2-oxo acid dehydrogenase subunit E2 [Spirochaetaceae bacterium]|jgi:hypothetical protein|nr:2-oxo acid dehydrogenase subunit E2 [Spirochaetaceae bacterium]